jgi:inner membrane protein
LDYAVTAAYHSLFMTARAGFRHNAISMDNLPHTLIGLVAGDAIARGTADAPGGLSAATRRLYFVTVAAIGSNIPDIDLVLTYGGFAPGKIGYLLHHRGYTHTLIGCVLLALLLHACVEVWARWRKQRLSRADRVGIAGVAVLGSLLHLLMDGMNSYGVHPYWPFENGWVYGDAVFIIEPLIWLSAIPLLFTVKTWLARIVVALAGIAALGIGVYLNREQSLWVAGLVLFAVALVLLGKRCSPRGAALASVAAMTGVTATFFFAGRITEHRVETLAAVTFPGEQTLDHVLTPVPTNPLCWDLLLIQTSGGRYIVRHGVVATSPQVLPAANCPGLGFSDDKTAPMTPVQASSNSSVQWRGEFSMSLAALASIANGNCEALEFMQFARAPFAMEREQRQVLGDLRFDREPELGLAEIELSSPPRQCRFHVPWIPPRESLLR